MPKTTKEQAVALATAHRTEDLETKVVLWAPDPNDREVRLVEVSESVGSTGEILPFRFAPQPQSDLPYPTVVVLVSPAEMDQLREGVLSLPESWGINVNELKELS